MFDFQPRLEEGLATLGLEASVDQVDQLMRFAGLLQKWNKVYNLTAIRRDDEILTHHLLDSAALVPFVKRLGPDAVNVLDVGSGGGLPSIPLAILRPDLRVTAVDAVSKTQELFDPPCANRTSFGPVRPDHVQGLCESSGLCGPDAPPHQAGRSLAGHEGRRARG